VCLGRHRLSRVAGGCSMKAGPAEELSDL
jgi:hypothetical protein